MASIFSDDIAVCFPPGELDGRTGLSALNQQILSRWGSTLHQPSNYQVTPIDGGAEFTAVLTATHVHRPPSTVRMIQVLTCESGRTYRAASQTCRKAGESDDS